MGREPQTAEIAGLKVTALPLGFQSAEPLIPEVGQFIGLVLEEIAKAFEGVDIKAFIANLSANGSADGKIDIGKVDVTKLLGAAGLKPDKFATAIRTAFTHLSDGKLSRLAPKILAATCVDMPDISGEMQRRDLSKSKDRETVFDEHPEAYLPIVWFAGRVTFGRYFSVAALTGGETPNEPS
jgi:hypothetical protein